ncbi:sulfurtransferase TusA family protein [Granulosicoccaceae sp. 1_MG-2023]|nr:sulfurtransferase TusA family protein [Granulosicoccaceae sp. 1_MG-2023]
MSVHKVDARRLLCPMPVIRLQDAVKKAAPGDIISVVCTDPGTMSDIPAWCRINGHRLQSAVQDGSEYFFEVETGNEP